MVQNSAWEADGSGLESPGILHRVLDLLVSDVSKHYISFIFTDQEVQNDVLCLILGFRLGVDENPILQEHYKEQIVSWLPTFRDNLPVPSLEVTQLYALIWGRYVVPKRL